MLLKPGNLAGLYVGMETLLWNGRRDDVLQDRRNDVSLFSVPLRNDALPFPLPLSRRNDALPFPLLSAGNNNVSSFPLTLAGLDDTSL